eukprot:UN04635
MHPFIIPCIPSSIRFQSVFQSPDSILNQIRVCARDRIALVKKEAE